MLYTVPDYFEKFRCLAGDCPATCCAGWQIMIDEKSLRKYRRFAGGFGNRLANSINWKEGSFRQYHGRCAFLNERNLCDIHLEAGSKMMCDTCRKYPRHIEVYENEREISLSLSCPAAAELILGEKGKASFRTVERNRREEQDEDFDFFLYSAFQDCRRVLMEMAQNRCESLELRMAKILCLAHDVQNRIDGRRVFQVEEVLERYRRPGAAYRLNGRLRSFLKERGENTGDEESRKRGPKPKECCCGVMEKRSALLRLTEEFEVLDPSWTEDRKRWQKILYQGGEEDYRQAHSELRLPEAEYEQLLVYFLFTYFCGAVYDGDALTKAKMAVVSVMILRELALALWLGQGKKLDFQDRKRLAWRYSRELEHSDPNLNKFEELLSTRPEAGFEELLDALFYR